MLVLAKSLIIVGCTMQPNEAIDWVHFQEDFAWTLSLADKPIIFTDLQEDRV